MNELKGLNDTLVFQVAQGPLLRQLHSQTELVQCTLVVVKALLPAKVLAHDVLDSPKNQSVSMVPCILILYERACWRGMVVSGISFTPRITGKPAPTGELRLVYGKFVSDPD